ncbi:hypothetical protein AB0H71_12930 [Nocardia sp. NPDC050697]|uniref:hypothetical protein n=1 Tax=Nocardia sp. NPDC050697 TaxID=3155158 RepID=UPI0033F5A06D
MIGKIALAALITASPVLVGCSPSDPPSATADGTVTSSTAAETEKCLDVEPAEARDADVKQLYATMKAMRLPAGTCFYAADTTDLVRQPGMIVVQIDLDVPASSGPDDLRPVATDIAHLLKKLDLAPRVAELAVTNWGDWEGSKIRYQDYLRDSDFQAHPWDGTPSRQAEFALWSIRSMN